MEKKNTKQQSLSKRDDPKQYSTPSQKIFGPNRLQINEDNASKLVGGITEKGISENFQNKSFTFPPAPKPSVLPFPVARHRSHGPHWEPAVSKKGGDTDNEGNEDDDDDDDLTNFGPMSAFANPVQRKEKKGLDLKRWRELIRSDNSVVTDKVGDDGLGLNKTGKQRKNRESIENAFGKNMSCDPSSITETPMEVDRQHKSLIEIEEAVSIDIDDRSLISATDMEIDNLLQVQDWENVTDAGSVVVKGEAGPVEKMLSNDVEKAQLEQMETVHSTTMVMLKKPEKKISGGVPSSSFSKFGDGQVSTTLEGEIDAENCARLKAMSPEEIEQAKAELMEKMDPSLLNLLKKRGQDKLKKKNIARLDEAVNGKLAKTSENQPKEDLGVPSHGGSNGSGKAMTSTSKNTKSGLDKSVVEKGNGSLWNCWKKRVEAVRGLRFSLEGTVVADESENGDAFIDNSYNADNVAARDILRTEGDPGAAGYTIKEAVQLTRSVIPGQRALALHLLASVLDEAIHNIQQNKVGCTMQNAEQVNKSVDWEAIWAYALGPEPELVLSLRMCLDDNHNSVVLACAKVIQCALSCDLNESFFELSEKIATYEKDIFTAPVFRSKSEINVGFLHGGFWKYSVKPSNILTLNKDVIDDEIESEHTIQDDIVVAGQDFAAGLVRMGILPRIRYLLEGNPTVVLEECIISILLAIARSYPTCADAILKCHRLVHTIVQRFAMEDAMEIHSSKIKSVSLLKVLAQSNKKNCIELIKNKSFEVVTRHLYRYTPSIDSWIKLGKEKCELSSALMVEQLRFWKVCIHYGFCISLFSDIFPALCLWVNPPSFKKLVENKILDEFASVSREGYLVLEALSRKLPNFYTQQNLSYRITDYTDDEPETWSWRYVTPVIDLALKWIASKSDTEIFEFVEGQKETYAQDSSVSSIFWVYSAVLHMLSSLLEKVNLEDAVSLEGSGGHVAALPMFVPKVGLEMIKNGFMSFSDADGTNSGGHIAGGSSLVERLCHLRQQSEHEASLASVCCLHGLLQVTTSIDKLIHLTKSGINYYPSKRSSLPREEKILEDGMLKSSIDELRNVLDVFMNLVTSEWYFVQSIETFGRGGPAPGVGLGWGASGGGFWSMTVLIAQIDSSFLIHLLELFQKFSSTELQTDDEMVFAAKNINSILGICLIVGPRDKSILEKAVDSLLQYPVLKHLGFYTQKFLQYGNKMKHFKWEYKEEDFLHFSKILTSHFKSRWLSGKKKKLKATDESSSSGNKTSKKGRVPLETIQEDPDASNMTNQDPHCTSLAAEWAHQRLPLPTHWFLSPISTISDDNFTGLQSGPNVQNLVEDPSGILEIANAGLFLILGLEAMSTFLPGNGLSPVCSVPLIWKIHSLSVILLVGMGVLEDEKSRDVYEALQDLYGQFLDDARVFPSAEKNLEENVKLLPEIGGKPNMEFMRFQAEIHESYSTFLETLVEQFAAISYGDIVFGRQIAIYLHRCTEAPVRLAAWNILANARSLEILPPLENCIGAAEGYLEPIEDNEGILEAYVKSWVSGALDRAATRGSMAFTLVLHHLSSFIFYHANGNRSLRNKLVTPLLRDYSQKQKSERMMLDLVQYHKSHLSEEQEGLALQSCDIDKRFEMLKEACERNLSLLKEVEKLKSAFREKYPLQV